MNVQDVVDALPQREDSARTAKAEKIAEIGKVEKIRRCFSLIPHSKIKQTE